MTSLKSPVSSEYSSSPEKINYKDPLLLLTGLGLFFGVIGWQMGLPNMLSTIMSTAHDLLLNTAFFILALMVVTGAFSSLLAEYGVIALLERLFAPFMGKPYKLPGRAALVAMMTFFSDNPAALSFAGDKKFARRFSPIQLATMTNFGTSFGMGFVVIAFMSSLSLESSAIEPVTATLLGLLAALAGSIISTRLLRLFCGKHISQGVVNTASDTPEHDLDENNEPQESRNASGFMRFMDALLEGGKNGVQLGISIIPGILIITTTVFILTMGAPEGGYTGGAYEGIAVFSYFGDNLSGIFHALFGFESLELIAFPISTLGSTGASLSLVPPFIEQGLVGGNEIAVFTAIGMCWSGFLCTHACMLDALGFRTLMAKAMLAHVIGGIAAGSLAHYLFLLIS